MKRHGCVALFATLALLVCPARAQGPSPRVTPSPEERLDALQAGLKAAQERLPFSLGAGVYLFYYQPLSADTTLAGGSRNGTFQVFFYYLKFSAEVRGFGGLAEVRLRDGGHVGPDTANTYFRGHYTSNLWLEQVYAYYTPGPVLKVKAGKVYRQFGIFWDDSFFGNIPFYDGLKLNPDYGLSAEGEKRFIDGRLGLAYAAQYFLQSDGINGGLEYRRTVGGVAPAAMGAAAGPGPLRLYSPNPEGQRDSGGSLITVLRHIGVGRLALSADPVRRFGVTAGGSVLTAQVRRVSARDRVDDEAQVTQGGGDLTLRVGPAQAYGEYIRQFGPGARDAHYVLAGARARLGPVLLRVNTSYVRYLLDPDIEEFMVQPGVTWTVGYGLTLFLEYNEWQRRDPRESGEAFWAYDRSLNTVIGYTF